MKGKNPITFPWKKLIQWYEKNGRHHLPWRQYEHPEKLYRVWLSEILLQQTQAERVIPFFENILEKYPTIHDLAKTNYDIFFPYYQGMGYYSRARNILKTAKIISEEYAGIFPIQKNLLQKLPGVGGYTSSAILAFGYGEPHLAWDTNLEKVFARYKNGRKDIKLTSDQKTEIEEDFQNFIQKVIQAKNKKFNTNNEQKIENHQGGQEQIELVRDINNALMDFASMIDLKNPDNIDWENYPIQEGMFYESRGMLEPIEERKSKIFPTPDATIIVILHQDHNEYYIPPYSEIYTPFILPAALHRDTRLFVQEYFRKFHLLELSVRPIHAKWLSDDGRPYIAVNAQIQAGDRKQFSKVDKKIAQSVLKKMIPE